MTDRIVIAIDGFSGTGKSSTAKVVAKKLGYLYLDSGAMYRCATLFFIRQSVNLNDSAAVKDALSQLDISFDTNEVMINGEPVTDEIRSMEVNNYVSEVSKIPAVRSFMVAQQQQLGANKGIVMDGRDIGTVVFPKAELKIFMTANARVRAQRRQEELEAKGVKEELDVIEKNLVERDAIDSGRDISPLIQAQDAITIDTSTLTFAEQVQQIIDLAQQKIAQ